MSLRNLNLKYVYDSDQDDILNEFYLPALSNSIRYRRLAGSFSSSALAIAARGVSRLIMNGGIMQLVVGAELRQKDIEAIIQGLKSREQVIADLMIKDLKTIEDLFVKDHVKALAWMVTNGKLEIKVAIALNKQGIPINSSTILKFGIFHPKIGILEDKEGNVVTFGGSINESMSGWLYNDENFYVFPSWVAVFQQISENNIKKFETCWNGKPNRFVVMDIPTAYQQELLKIAPTSLSELNLEKWYLEKHRMSTLFHHKYNPNDIKPWMCQQRAIDAFKTNNYKGILKMATGTGKTVCALFILESFLQEQARQDNRVMILVPSGKDRIGGQWETFLRKNTSSKDYVFRFDSETATQERRDMVRLWRKGVYPEGNIFVISTIQSLGVFPFNGIFPNFLIADEVHEYGTTNRIRTIISKIGEVQYKLGLSATPERFYDPEGTASIMNFFGPIVYKYTIKEAQNEEKFPNAEKVLANYLYNLVTVHLTDKEEKKIKKLTKQIGMTIAINDDPNISERSTNISTNVNRLLQIRAKIVKTAVNKFDALENLLKKEGNTLRCCIVYCEDTKQLDNAEKVFKKLGMTSYVKYHYKVESRAESLELFKEHDCDFILSINCLDQGIDIPSCQSLILLSSSTNPRQYIQRRGRALRNYEDKPLVQIFDILAFPKEESKGYHGLIKSQLLRAWEFIRASQSPEEKAKLIDIRMKYGIPSEELTKEIEGW